MDGTALVERDVRELVRGRGLDPAAQPEAIYEAVTEAIAAYDEQSLRGHLPPLADREATRKAVLDAVAGLGPLQPFLDDEQVEEIWINSPTRVFVARGGRTELTSLVLTEAQVRLLVEQMLMASGRRLDLSSPFVDAALATGERLHVAIPDVTRRHWAVNIRKYVAKAKSLDDLAALGTLTQAAARLLAASVRAGLTIVVAGATQAGKTTLLGALASAIPASERIVSCEEVFELSLDGPDVVAMQCRAPNLEGQGEITLRRLVTESLRMRPARLIIGEVRQAEALDLLLALNAGVPGMCTVHANSAREAIGKLTTLPLLAGENVTDRFVIPAVAGSVDLVAFMTLAPDGARRLTEVLAVPGGTEAGVIATEPVLAMRGGRLVAAGGQLPRPERFARAGIDPRALLAAAER